MEVKGIKTGSLHLTSSLHNPPTESSLLTTVIGHSTAAFTVGAGWPNGVSTLLKNLGKATGVSRGWIFQVLKITETHVHQNYIFEWAKSAKYEQIGLASFRDFINYRVRSSF